MSSQLPIFNKTMHWEWPLDEEPDADGNRPIHIIPPLKFEQVATWEDNAMIVRCPNGKLFTSKRYLEEETNPNSKMFGEVVMRYEMHYALKPKAGKLRYTLWKMNTQVKPLPPGGPFGHGNYKKQEGM